MKSIVEEANSVIKAIDAGWKRAGEPSEFSVKIFEREEKNFLGITQKKAKIGIIFKEEMVENRKHSLLEESKKNNSPAQEVKQKTIKKIRSSRVSKEKWTTEMVTSAKEWITQCLTFMGLPNVQFNTTVSNNYLNFFFDVPIISESGKEKILFRNFAYLIMLSLRNRYKTDFRHLKIILKRT